LNQQHQHIHILCLEDSPERLEEIQALLQKLEGSIIRMTNVKDEAGFTVALNSDAPDLILAEHDLPNLSGSRALELARQSDPHIPFIFVCEAPMDETLAMHCIRHEVEDYVTKDHMARLPAAVNHVMVNDRMKRDKRSTEETLHRREAILSGVCQTASDLLMANHWEDVIGRTIADLGMASSARNLTIFRNENHPTAGPIAVPTANWHHPSIRTRDIFSFNFSYGQLEEELKILSEGKSVVLESTRLPNVTEDLHRLNIHRMVLIPVITNKRLWGCFALAPLTPESMWKEEELPALKAAADIFSAAVVREETSEALHLSEESLRQSQKMEALGVLAGGVAHDFNNMLTSILGYARMIHDKVGADAEIAPDLEEIIAAGDRAAVLARRLLLFGRKHVTRKEPLNVSGVVRSIGRMLERMLGEDVRLKLEPVDDLASIKADKMHIEQLIMNFAVNARDAMPKGGELLIRTQNAYLDEAFCRKNPTLTPGPHVQLTVTDSGVGIPKSMQEKIFEPFYTTKDLGKGTGLGLSTCLKIIQEYHGEFVLHSELGKGTTFHVYFPTTSSEVVQRQDDPVWHEQYKGTETILIIEDEEVVNRVAQRTLKAAGYRVFSAMSGPEAFEIAKRIHGNIDLMIVDVVMPEISGPEAVQKLRELGHKSARILYMSGFSESVISRHGIDRSTDRVLIKPFTRTGLSKVVRDALDDLPQQPSLS